MVGLSNDTYDPRVERYQLELSPNNHEPPYRPFHDVGASKSLAETT